MSFRPALAWTLLCGSLAVMGCQKTPPASSTGDCPSACAQGEVCKAGKCFPAQCENERCGALEVCLNGACAASACVGVLCPGDQLCAAGECLPRRCGGGDFCKSSEVCRDGACVDARCVGVQCGADEICASGRCYSPSCGGTACGNGQVCEAGSCVNLACAGVVCPQGLQCVQGVCSSVCPTGQEWSGNECVPKQGAPVPQTLRGSPASVSITKGTSQQLKAELVWTDGSVTDVTSTATWDQGTDCFFVDHGLVTATGYETCTEALHIHSDGLEGIIQITVGPPVVTGLKLVDLTVTGNNFTWAVGELHRLVPQYVWSDLTTSNVDVSGVTWSSSDPSIIKLDPDVSIPNARYGHAVQTGTATVTIALGAQTATASITVSGRAPLSLTRVTPTVGYPGGVISIFGGGFDPNLSANVVKVGTHPATVVSVSPQAMTVQLPNTPGYGALTIATDAGLITATDPVVIGIPDAGYLSPPGPVTDSVGRTIDRTLVDGYLISDNGFEAYYQQERLQIFSTLTFTFDLGTAQQPVEHVVVRAFDASNGCVLGFAPFYPPTQIGVSVADSLSAFDGGTSTYTGYFSNTNPTTCGGMKAFIVATPGGTGRYVQVSVTPSSASQTIADEILFSPE